MQGRPDESGLRRRTARAAFATEDGVTLMDLETLYPLVTDAIRRAEVLDELHAPGARVAYLDVSILEEQIATLLPPSKPEGAIARRGAITAAISAQQYDRAQELVARFSDEQEIEAPLRSDLKKLRKEALSMALQAGRVMATRFPRVSERYGLDEVRRFARAFQEQGAPLPIC